MKFLRCYEILVPEWVLEGAEQRRLLGSQLVQYNFEHGRGVCCIEFETVSRSITITGYSTALFSTWYLLEEYGILFDCGDGVSAGLLQKGRKVKHAFISHADRDHLGGLLQFLQLNGRPELVIHYPQSCGSFPALAGFTAKFDPHTADTQWSPLVSGSEIQIRDDLVVRALENRHVPADESQTKSLSFVVESVRRKRKQEFVDLPGNQIAALRQERGADALTYETHLTELIYSGDTPVETDGRYQGAKVLIHEATFLTRDEIDPDNPRRNKHSSLDATMEMVAEQNVEMLILGHFSSRYSDEQIDEAIDREIIRCGIKVPVHRVYPGRMTRLSTLA